ncbi:LLM class F420-dependent oxidoreductase [Dictyobacter arantiisoli]|uniref:LLM class F420-dependent oxidoreductase n=1 Tax=Dictyobacter arantiisoli TaxID=2014874 RepID=A0A5A5T8B6_9CHLR|nr:LLM class F420-dependent oxidoreductase [Dictyobacter arantiisoli]GCF07406.1 LLM class F420-dependent oxidoreductase [Dictyobacter arantiisoli]
MSHLSFGIKTAPQWTTYEDMLSIWQDADAEPTLEHAWLFDHFFPLSGDLNGPCLEGWTVLSALAAVTKRIRLGLMVTGNTYRHPAVLANIAATVDIISKGRLDFGIGAGWNEAEHEAYGIPLYKPGERLRRLEEACEIIKRMWTEAAPTFEGRYYQIKDAYCEPKPVQKPYPPFVIGGGGEKLTLRIVAKYANIWNIPGGTPEDFKHKSAILDEHCAAIGRNPAEIARSIQIVINPNNLQETREAIQKLINVGANHIVLNLRPPYPAGIVHRLVTEIVEPLTNTNA